MATYTPNLNLKKPSGNEYYDVVAEDNDAKDKIDAAVRIDFKNISSFPLQIPEADDSGRFQRAANSGFNIALKKDATYTVKNLRISRKDFTLYGNNAKITPNSMTHSAMIIESASDGIFKSTAALIVGEAFNIELDEVILNQVNSSVQVDLELTADGKTISSPAFTIPIFDSLG